MIYGGAGSENIKVAQVRTGCWSSVPMSAGDVLEEGQVRFLRLVDELKQAGLSCTSDGAVVRSETLTANRWCPPP